jgi:hypothetical protein
MMKHARVRQMRAGSFRHDDMLTPIHSTEFRAATLEGDIAMTKSVEYQPKTRWAKCNTFRTPMAVLKMPV